MTRKSTPSEVPAALAYALTEVQLIDGPTAAAVGGASVTFWQAEVRAGRAPKPVIQRPRFSRWRLADVTEYWRRAAQGVPSAPLTQRAGV